MMEEPVFEVKCFQTIEEYTHALDIGQQVIKRLKTEERNRQLWGGKYTGKMRGKPRKIKRCEQENTKHWKKGML